MTSVFLTACTAQFEVKLPTFTWAKAPGTQSAPGWWDRAEGTRVLLCCWLAWWQWTTSGRALWEGWWHSLEAREAGTRYYLRSFSPWPILWFYDRWSSQESHFFRRSVCFSSTTAFMHLTSACICGTEDVLLWVFPARTDLSYYHLDYSCGVFLPCYCLLFFAMLLQQ